MITVYIMIYLPLFLVEIDAAISIHIFHTKSRHVIFDSKQNVHLSQSIFMKCLYN